MKPTKIIQTKGNKIEINQELLPIHPFSTIKPTDDNYKWLAVIHYMLYPYPDDNPFYYTSEIEKEQTICKRLKLNIIHKPTWYEEVYNFVKNIYETPMMRLLRTYKTTIDKMSYYLENIQIDDKNFKNVSSFVKEYETIREGYKKILKDVEDEINYKAKGNTKIGYDIV